MEIIIPCCLCRTPVSVGDCVENGGGLLRGVMHKQGNIIRGNKNVLVCPGCVRQYGCDSAVDSAVDIIDVLIEESRKP